MKVEKSGMLVNAQNEVIGWFNAGDEVELKQGDTIVSHHKTADKKGLLAEFNTLKAENAPAKKEKAEGGEKKKTRGPRVETPKTGTYTVASTKAMPAEDDTSVRAGLLRKLMTGTSFDAFFADAPEKFNHAGRDGTEKEFTSTGLVSYAIRRGMITVDA